MRRERRDLAGVWRFQPDACDEGETVGYHDAGYDISRWREVAVPCSFASCGPGMESYEGAGWFRRSFTVPDAWRGRRVLARFEGVNYHARVWVNGDLAGDHEDGFLRFELPVHHLLRHGQDNVIVVRAGNTRRQGEVPGRERGWRPYGGILREVELIASDLLHLESVRLMADPVQAGGQLSLEACLANGRAEAAEATIAADIADSEGSVCLRLSAGPITLSPGAEALAHAEGFMPGARPWSPQNPALYTARISVYLGDELVDSLDVRFGFRRIEARDDKLLLNGELLFLTGFNRHEDSPRTGMCPDLDMVRRDLMQMKNAGANFVRLCHYPHHPGELDLCDELGLLAMGEIPLYWWNGLAEGPDNRASKLEAAKRQLTRMISRDLNHPSIIFWSVSNETHEQRPEVVEGNAALVCLAQELDPTRLALHVSDHWRDHPHFETDDVVCVNGYPTWAGRSRDASYDVAESARFWSEGLERLHRQCPGKPILVTEFGYPCLEGVRENALGEDMQARAIEAEFGGVSAPYVCGATLWCYADHPWPEEDFIRYLTTSPYGVVTRQRRRLQGFWAVRKLFREKQGQVPEVAPAGVSAEAADLPVHMIRPHMDDIPQVPFPEGFSIRPMRRGEAALWTDIERDAEEYVAITDEVFEQEFGDDLQATERRCFFVVDAKGVAVGTISAWYSRDFKGQDYGRIHWVAIRRAYQGQGLGKAALSYAMNRLAEWHERCWLATSTARLPALKLYLDFGFVPDLDPPGAREAWRQVRAALPHPALQHLDKQ